MAKKTENKSKISFSSSMVSKLVGIIYIDAILCKL